MTTNRSLLYKKPNANVGDVYINIYLLCKHAEAVDYGEQRFCVYYCLKDPPRYIITINSYVYTQSRYIKHTCINMMHLFINALIIPRCIYVDLFTVDYTETMSSTLVS